MMSNGKPTHELVTVPDGKAVYHCENCALNGVDCWFTSDNGIGFGDCITDGFTFKIIPITPTLISDTQDK